MQALLDSGASCTIISEELVDTSEILPAKINVLDASGNRIPIIGRIKTIIKTPGGIITEFMLVRKSHHLNMKFKLIIGMNILSRAEIDFRTRKIKFDGDANISEENYRHKFQIMDELISNFNMNGMCGGIVQATPECSKTEDDQLKGRIMRKSTPVAHSQEETVEGDAQQESDSGDLVKTRDTSAEDDVNLHILEEVEIPPNSLSVLRVRVNEKFNEKQLLIENREIRKGVRIPNIIAKVENQCMQMNFLNITDDRVILNQGSFITKATICKEEEPQRIQTIVEKNRETKKLRELVESDLKCENAGRKKEVLQLLNRYRGAIWLEGEPLGCFKGEKMKIELKCDEIVNKKQFPIEHGRAGKVYEKIAELERQKVIVRSKSSFNAPVVPVDKPGGGIRVCIDYRALNAITKPISFPIPRISELLNSLGSAKIISSIDLAAAYHQCEIRKEDQHKTAFTINNKKFEYNRIPFGLVSAPMFFSRIISDTLIDLLGDQVLCYLDDIIVFSKNEEEHLGRIEEVLKRLAKVDLKIKLEKCIFFAKEINFLGYVVSGEGLQMNEARADAIRKMPYPTSKRTLQAFLGACNYYRMFVEGIASIAEPLYKLLRKNARFIWGEEQSNAVDTLKNKLSCAPILTHPDFSKDFIIHTDASQTGIGACLMQVHNKKLHPISYVSKGLSETQQNYSTTKREALGLVYALEQFRQIIMCYKVHMYTDHEPLIGIPVLVALIPANPSKTNKRWVPQ